MLRVIEILRRNGIDCLPNERFTLDVAMFPSEVEDLTFPSQVIFEDPPPKSARREVPECGSSPFRYFLDGSQRSYRVIDASIHGRYLPICAGQIGVAVLERSETGRLSPRRDLTLTENLLSVPNKLPEDQTADLQEAINKHFPPAYWFRLVRYDYSAKADKDPGDLARAMIIHAMQLLELKTIRKMISACLIQPLSMLAKDGGLQYRDTKIKDLGLGRDDRVQLRNVIGLAKTFSPSLTLGKGRGKQDLGNLTKGLDWRERTPVISPNPTARIAHGWWYLRLRPRERVYSPLQGIAKVEVFADEVERESGGVASERADAVASYILAERNVTPYGADRRWASHIYPIFLTETYLKSSFLSHSRFKSLIL